MEKKFSSDFLDLMTVVDTIPKQYLHRVMKADLVLHSLSCEEGSLLDSVVLKIEGYGFIVIKLYRSQVVSLSKTC